MEVVQMGGGHFWRGAFGALLGLALLALVAGFAYQAGTHAAVGAAGGGEMRTYGWHGGFFFFPFLFFPFGFFLFFAVMRMLFWGGPRRWSGGGYGPYQGGPYRGGPGRFEEWHRRMHEQQGTPASTPAAPNDPAPPTSS